MGKVYKYIHISLHKRKIRSLHDLKILKPDPGGGLLQTM